MHARVTVHDHVFEAGVPVGDVAAAMAAGGAQRVGISRRRVEDAGWEVTAAALAGSGLELTHVVHGALFHLADEAGWEAEQMAAIATLDAAAGLGARCVYGVTGSAGALTWEQAADAFVLAVEPVAAHASRIGLPLLIEPTNLLFADVGFLHTLRDTVEVARRTGLGVCLDVQHCFAERDLRESIRRAAGSLGLVQLSDWIPGRRTPFRAVPGDGAIPLERIVAATLEDGYGGLFDLELYPEPGVAPAATIRRAAERVGEMLRRLGA
jgi:sugar phosphate isomerase/epimerase